MPWRIAVVKGLKTLIRLHRQRLDEKRVRRLALEEERGALVALADGLERELEAEWRTAAESLESRYTFEAYAERMIARRRALAGEIATFDVALDKADNEIAAAFQELKRYEISRNAREMRAQTVRARRERMQLDEIGANQRRRVRAG